MRMATEGRREVLQAVSVTATWLEPFGHEDGCPDVGMLAIDGRRYSIGRGSDYFLLLAVDADKQGNRGEYHLPLDGLCDCPDAQFRSQRPRGCRHAVALRLLGLRE